MPIALADRQRAYREKKLARGLCSICTAKAVCGKTRCAACLVADNERAKARYQKRPKAST